MCYLKQIDLPQSKQAILTLPQGSLAHIWVNDSIQFNDSDLNREFSLRILPLIERGMTRGETRLMKVRYFEHVEGQVVTEGIGNPVFTWEVKLQWWSPENHEWWTTPFCGQYVPA